MRAYPGVQPPPQEGRPGREVRFLSGMCLHQGLLVGVVWLVAGPEPAAEPGPGRVSSWSLLAAGASLPWPQRREKHPLFTFLVPSICEKEGSFAGAQPTL